MNPSIETPAQIPNTRSRLTASLILMLPVLVLVAATVMYQTGLMNPGEKNNQGNLLSPVLQLQDLLPQDYQRFRGHWQLILFDDGAADGRTHEWLYWTRQIHVALGKYMPRVQRLFITTQDKLPARVNEIEGYQTLRVDHEQLEAFMHGQLQGDPIKGAYLMIADPLGNVMLYYTAEHNGKQVTSDLKKLLKLSTIG
ncbi:hypothetical protein [Gynuella sunshinyii]|uniref:Thioredoxin domain-containing protein n=1 Tax=Gynuella sunshinyii YC6258 TaxID=1445510 RepID=A0A0C5UZR9_9GAMM|nr:hypothetical protein [Gynuella sunshinyii]AJQ92780.1 hypothetical Protein YC6258_00730 [Gynuella sunshinyii YC6258]